MGEELHPDYGDCDGFGPKGECSECTGLIEQEDGTVIDYRTGKIVRSIVPPSQPQGWQPIETAPRDGTKIDVWTAGGERWPNVWWEPDKHDWLHWWWDGFGMGCQRLNERITHWMPLPEAP